MRSNSRGLFGFVGILLLYFGCRTAAHNAPAPPNLPATGTAVREAPLPLCPDPGPAAGRPLSPLLKALPKGSKTPFLRLLVELREQVDLPRLMQEHDRLGLPRSERRKRTLAGLRQVASRGEAALSPLLGQLEKDGLLDYFKPIRFRNRFFLSVKLEAVPRIAADPSVAELIPEYDSVRDFQPKPANQMLRPAPPVPPGDSWGVQALGLPDIWQQGFDGRGVVIGILDTGVFPNHLALEPGRRGKDDWFDPETGNPTLVDTAPHGSMVLACAVGRTVRGHALGAAPGASWVAALANFHNSYNNILMSLSADWMIFEAQPDIVLNAWGHGKGKCDPRDREMVEAFRASGILPIFAAGNDGPDPASGQTPGALGGLYRGGPLSVAAVDRHIQVIPESSRGPSPCGRPSLFPDLAAPGFDLPAPGLPGTESLTLVSGTSFAVGWVAGVAAFVLQIQPEIPVPDLEDLLRHATQDLPPAGPDTLSGYGLIDPRAAIAAARIYQLKPVSGVLPPR